MSPDLASLGVDFYPLGPARQPQTLFVLGGRAPDSPWLSDFAARNSLAAYAVDSGVAVCRRAGLTPLAIVGDRDSAAAEDWEWALRLGAREFVYPSGKDLTDFQLALGLIDKKDRCGLVLTGCFGGRFDHLFSITGTFTAVRPLCMIDEQEGLFLVEPGREMRVVFKKKPVAVSLLPLSEECTGVRIGGVRWPLGGVTIERASPWTVSNETLPGQDGTCAKNVSVSCESGVMGFYWSFHADLQSGAWS
ncbi:MAG: thiamine diphosphokinase [Synergistaceae bacterium]|nr:thiamine diphosphokinase [Synergistaceae bacterium]